MHSALFVLLSLLPAMAKPALIPADGSFHAIYLSVVRIEHQETEPYADILVKVFADDLRDVIRAADPATYIPADHEDFCAVNRSGIQAYFQDKLRIEVNGKSLPLYFLEGRAENDVYWLNFRLEGPAQWREVRLNATFFMEIFSTQSNIIQLIHAQEKRFARLTREAQTVDFSF